MTVVDLAGNLESESEPDPQRHAPSPPDQGDRASSLLVCHQSALLRLPNRRSNPTSLASAALPKFSLGGKRKEKKKKGQAAMRCNRMHVHCNDFGGSTHSLRSPTALILYPLGLGLACNVSAPPGAAWPKDQQAWSGRLGNERHKDACNRCDQLPFLTRPALLRTLGWRSKIGPSLCA